MKKISLILVVILALSTILVGCGEKKTNSQVISPAPNAVNQNANNTQVNIDANQSKGVNTSDTQGEIVLNTSQNNDNSTVDNAKQIKTITKSDAEQIIRNIKGNLPKNYFVQYDNTQSRDGREYYVIHIYEFVVDDPATSEGHTATFGWYMVDKQTGKAFEWDLGSDKLVPMD